MPEATANVVASRAIHGRRSRPRTRATGAEDVRANKTSSSLKTETKSDETPSEREASSSEAPPSISKTFIRETASANFTDNPFNVLPYNEPAPDAQNVRNDSSQPALTFQADNLPIEQAPSDIVEAETPFPAWSNLPLDRILSPPVIAFICSTHPQPKSKADTAVVLRHKKNAPNLSTSTTEYQSSQPETSRHGLPREHLVNEPARFPDLPLQRPQSDLSPRHRSATNAFLPKKYLPETDYEPCARPIHPAISSFFHSSTHSPFSIESPLQNTTSLSSPSLAGPTLQTTSTFSSPFPQNLHAASTTPIDPDFHEWAITPSPSKRGSLSSPITTSDSPTDHQLDLHHFSSYDPLGEIIQKTPLGRILAIAAEVAASQSATVPQQCNGAVDVRPRCRQETSLTGGDIWTRPGPARTRAPKVGRETSGSWVGVREPRRVGVGCAGDEGGKGVNEAGWVDGVERDGGYVSCDASLEGRERDVEWESSESGGSSGEEYGVEGDDDEEGKVEKGEKSGRRRRRKGEREDDDWVGFNEGFWRYLLVDGKRSREVGGRL